MNLIIAQCPRCKQNFHGWDKEESLIKYYTHVCLKDKSEEEFWQIIDDIIKRKRF